MKIWVWFIICALFCLFTGYMIGDILADERATKKYKSIGVMINEIDRVNNTGNLSFNIKKNINLDGLEFVTFKVITKEKRDIENDIREFEEALRDPESLNY